MGDTSQTHFHGCKKIRQQTRRWYLIEPEVEAKRIIDTEYINERVISTTIVVNRQRIKLMSENFSHSGYADHHIEKCTKRSRSTLKIAKDTFQKIGGDFNANWDLDTEMNVTVWAITHSTRETKEVTG